MKKTLIMMLTAVALATGIAFAHDASKHKGKPVQGEVIASSADRFEVKTESGVVPVTFSSKTKFEHGNATVDNTHVTKVTQVSIFGTKLPSGDMVAREVLIGTGAAKGQPVAQKESTSSSTTKKTPAEAHKH